MAAARRWPGGVVSSSRPLPRPAAGGGGAGAPRPTSDDQRLLGPLLLLEVAGQVGDRGLVLRPLGMDGLELQEGLQGEPREGELALLQVAGEDLLGLGRA